MTEDDGWIEFKRCTVFVGNQGSGKSTIAKLFSTFSWIEKALVRGDYDQKWFERKNRFANQFLKYHRLESYLSSQESAKTRIEYEGEAYHLTFADGALEIVKVLQRQNYLLPQLMYVPAERNFISYVRSPRELRLASDALKEFLVEFDNAKNGMRNSVRLPINDVDLEYDKLNDILNIKDANYKLRLTDASSGFQSSVPLYLVSKHLAEAVHARGEQNHSSMSAKEAERFKERIKAILFNDSLTEEQQRIAISALSSEFNNAVFVNIVEEPEQNLFPSSQWEMLRSLLEFNNMTAHNSLVLTTHSPYIVNYLSIAVQAAHLRNRIDENHAEALLPKLEKIVPAGALIAASDLAIYQLDESQGTVARLADYEGIPSDHNYLNDMLREGNQLFDALLEIEEEL